MFYIYDIKYLKNIFIIIRNIKKKNLIKKLIIFNYILNKKKMTIYFIIPSIL